MEAKVSVIVPTRDRSGLLREAVNSILAQTVAPHEIIIVDDGSAPEHQGTIRSLASVSSKIVLNHFPVSKGVSAARNSGIEKATGDYIVFLDDDDLMHAGMIESNLECFENHREAHVVVCRNCIFVEEPVCEPCLPTTFIDYQNLEREPFSQILIYGLAILSCMVRRDALKGVRFPEDLLVGEDTFFWLRLVSQGCRFKFNPNAHAFVRRHSGNSSTRMEVDGALNDWCLKMLQSGMLKNGYDRMFVHGKLMIRMFKSKDPEALRHLAYVLRSPHLALRYLHLYTRMRYKINQRANLLKIDRRLDVSRRKMS